MTNTDNAARALQAAAQLAEVAAPRDVLMLHVEVPGQQHRDALRYDYMLSVHPESSKETSRKLVHDYAMRLQPDPAMWRLHLVSDFYSARATVLHPGELVGEVRVFLTPRQALQFERAGVDMADPEAAPPSSFLANLTALVEGATS